MIALDTNILVYAHREDSAWFRSACDCIERLCRRSGPWAIPWPCIDEFLAIVTHPRIYSPPTPLEAALDQVAAWCEAPNLFLLSESPGYLEKLSGLLKTGLVTGPQVHDARIAALCLHHGIRELWTADRDFSRFSNLKTSNPML
jgi:toxin-antitoxin system PIN domain toxin